MIGRPAERLVDMALIARDRSSRRHARCNAGRINAMATYRGKKRVAGVRHVAIVATASSRIDSMMRVLGYVTGQLLMALQTRLVGIQVRSHLLIWLTRMHRMTGQAGHATVKITSGILHAGEFSTTNTHRPIPPETDIVWIMAVGQLERAFIVSTRSILVVLRWCLLVECDMALSTNLR